MQSLAKEVKQELTGRIVPFWEGLRDEEYGGFYGYQDFDLNVQKTYEKGCILNSRILWFFSNAYLTLKDEKLRADAEHAYRFMKQACVDREYGGVFWSVTYDGKPLDTTKHTYNQAFAIYALSTYFDATGDTGGAGAGKIAAADHRDTLHRRVRLSRGIYPRFQAGEQ